MERDRDLHLAGHVRVIEPVYVPDSLIRREFDVLAAKMTLILYRLWHELPCNEVCQ